MVELRIHAELAARDDFELVRTALRHDVRPLPDCHVTDSQGTSRSGLRLEMCKDVFFEHAGSVTAVAAALQPSLRPQDVTLVAMSKLQERLNAALIHGKKTRQDLIDAKITSRQAVNKWFDSDAKNLKMEHLFRVADFCKVDPRWLATGKDAKPVPAGKASGTCTHTDIPEHRIRLIRMYSDLPQEDRAAARRFIELMAWQHHPHKDEYVKRVSKKPDMVHEE